MLIGVLSMPFEMAMSDDLSRFQFHNRAQQAVGRIQSDERRIEQLKDQLIALSGAVNDVLARIDSGRVSGYDEASSALLRKLVIDAQRATKI